jgi:hypothetical protein
MAEDRSWPAVHIHPTCRKAAIDDSSVRSGERSPNLDNVKQDGRFTDNHLGRSTGLIVGGYSPMFVAPSF